MGGRLAVESVAGMPWNTQRVSTVAAFSPDRATPDRNPTDPV